MALITKITEIKDVLPKLLSNLNSASLMSNFDAIEEKYLTPVIGDALYADLQTKYSAATLSVGELTLVKHIRLMTAAQGLLDDMAANHVFYTDQGMRTSATGNMPKAVGWEYKKLEGYLQNKTLDGLEVLLKYMWKNKATLALWTASDEYKQFEGLLIRTGTDFDSYYKLYQPMRTFYALKTILKDQQKNYLVSGLGADLVSYLVKKAAPVDKEKEIIIELKTALANFTIKHACEKFEVRLSDNGFTIINQVMGADRESDDTGRSGATIQAIDRLSRACDRDGKKSMQSAKSLLIAFKKSGSGTTEFNTAFEAGPLKAKAEETKKKPWNNKCRKGFRMR